MDNLIIAVRVVQALPKAGIRCCWCCAVLDIPTTAAKQVVSFILHSNATELLRVVNRGCSRDGFPREWKRVVDFRGKFAVSVEDEVNRRRVVTTSDQPVVGVVAMSEILAHTDELGPAVLPIFELRPPVSDRYVHAAQDAGKKAARSPAAARDVRFSGRGIEDPLDWRETTVAVVPLQLFP